MTSPDYAAATIAVHEVMLGAFGGHVNARIASLGIDTADVADSVEVGNRWLAGHYRDQQELPPADQDRSPLELFQAACAFPTERLDALGVERLERDPIVASALPGDVYALAPASSQELGDDVWRLHVAWGVAKASIVASVVPRPVEPERTTVGVAVVSANLMDRTRMVDTATGLGLSSVAWRNPGAVQAGLASTSPVVVFLDLEHAMADDILRMLVTEDHRVIAYGPHVDDVALARAGSLGASEVLPRSRLFKRLQDWMPRPL